jgi:hypothetical protein
MIVSIVGGSWTSCLKGGHPIFSIAARKEQDLEKKSNLKRVENSNCNERFFTCAVYL